MDFLGLSHRFESLILTESLVGLSPLSEPMGGTVRVRFLAGRKARREQIEELPVSFADRRGDRVDKAARGGRRIKERRESRGSIGGRTEPS
jgi:hypothetical protein